MPLKLNPQTSITMLDPDFVQAVNSVIDAADIPTDDGAVINFRDPSYSAERGGYHPVELSMSRKGDLLYLTDFAYFGRPPFIELGVEFDWNFELNSFRQFDSWYDLDCGRCLLGLYTRNFVAYHKSGVYKVEVSPR